LSCLRKPPKPGVEGKGTMPSLKIKGKTDNQINQRKKAEQFGYELIRLIEDAQTVAHLENKLSRMRVWLSANPEHPQLPQRDQRYWHVVMARNEAQATLNERAAGMVRLHRDLTADAVAAMSEAYGAPARMGMVGQITKIAKEHGEDGIWEVVDRWALEQTAKQDRMAL
jgi:hypothetical protein